MKIIGQSETSRYICELSFSEIVALQSRFDGVVIKRDGKEYTCKDGQLKSGDTIDSWELTKVRNLHHDILGHSDAFSKAFTQIRGAMTRLENLMEGGAK